MSKLLFVKSGSVEQPVPDILDLPIEELKNVMAGKKLKFLGEELPPVIGEADKMQDFRAPTYVVLQATETELKRQGRFPELADSLKVLAAEIEGEAPY